MDKKGGLKAVMMHSFLLSRGYEGFEYTEEDIKNMSNPDISNCQIDLYIKVIRLLSEGKTYEEVCEFISNYNQSDYEKLEEKQKTYIKSRVRQDLNYRKMSLGKGEDK